MRSLCTSLLLLVGLAVACDSPSKPPPALGGAPDAPLVQDCREGFDGAGTCTCAGVDECAPACDAGQCDASCESTSSCDMSCDGASACAIGCHDSAGCGLSCAGSPTCTPECDGSAQCDIACEGSEACAITCADSATCATECADATSCALACSGSALCGTDCGDAEECTVECTESAQCDVACPDGAACGLTCDDTAMCRCTGEGCALECEGREPYACGGAHEGVYVCDPAHCDGVYEPGDGLPGDDRTDALAR